MLTLTQQYFIQHVLYIHTNDKRFRFRNELPFSILYTHGSKVTFKMHQRKNMFVLHFLAIFSNDFIMHSNERNSDKSWRCNGGNVRANNCGIYMSDEVVYEGSVHQFHLQLLCNEMFHFICGLQKTFHTFDNKNFPHYSTFQQKIKLFVLILAKSSI